MTFFCGLNKAHYFTKGFLVFVDRHKDETPPIHKVSSPRAVSIRPKTSVGNLYTSPPRAIRGILKGGGIASLSVLSNGILDFRDGIRPTRCRLPLVGSRHHLLLRRCHLQRAGKHRQPVRRVGSPLPTAPKVSPRGHGVPTLRFFSILKDRRRRQGRMLNVGWVVRCPPPPRYPRCPHHPKGPANAVFLFPVAQEIPA